MRFSLTLRLRIQRKYDFFAIARLVVLVDVEFKLEKRLDGDIRK